MISISAKLMRRLIGLLNGIYPPQEQKKRSRSPLKTDLQEALMHFPPEDESQFLSLLDQSRVRPPLRAPPIDDLLRRSVGPWGMARWLLFDQDKKPLPADKIWPKLTAFVTKWLMHQPTEERDGLLDAGARFGLQRTTSKERALLQQSYQAFLKAIEKETPMTDIKFYVDPRGLPSGFEETKYIAAVAAELENTFGLANTDENAVTYGTITGMLLLDEQFHPDGFGFRPAVQKAWQESLGKTKRFQTGETVTNRDMYDAIGDVIMKLNGGRDTIGYQQFASVARYVIERADDVPLGHPDFSSQVRVGLDRFVGGAAPVESLTLPPLTGENGQDTEIEPDNIRAVSLIYASNELEGARIFHVVDRLTELFVNGMLPLGFDAGGKALDNYYWNAEDRMTEPARRMQYSRVLGAPGGEVSREAAPNKTFNNLMLRFLSSLAEYDRQQRIGDLFDSRRRSLTTTGEQVRKSGRDLAANASLYGWGGTHFSARRLNSHLSTAIDILKQPQVQKAYGATGPWQVVERVAAAELGGPPNIVKHRTRAESGKIILDMVAKYAAVWGANTNRPLFTELLPGTSGDSRVITGDIPLEDKEVLLRHTQYWLAVTGVEDAKVDRMAQPVESINAPSLPNYGGVGGGTGGKGFDQLKDMISSGQTPSLDELKAMLPAMG